MILPKPKSSKMTETNVKDWSICFDFEICDYTVDFLPNAQSSYQEPHGFFFLDFRWKGVIVHLFNA